MRVVKWTATQMLGVVWRDPSVFHLLFERARCRPNLSLTCKSGNGDRVVSHSCRTINQSHSAEMTLVYVRTRTQGPAICSHGRVLSLWEWETWDEPRQLLAQTGKSFINLKDLLIFKIHAKRGESWNIGQHSFLFWLSADHMTAGTQGQCGCARRLFRSSITRAVFSKVSSALHRLVVGGSTLFWKLKWYLHQEIISDVLPACFPKKHSLDLLSNPLLKLNVSKQRFYRLVALATA